VLVPDTFGPYAAEFLAREASRLSPTSLATYRYVVATYLGDLHDVGLHCITRRVAKELLAELAKRLSPATVRQIQSVLSVVMADAVDSEILPANPLAGLRRPPRRAFRPLVIPDALTVARLLEVAWAVDQTLAPLYVSLARAGLRVGEAQALQPADCDFVANVLTVRRSAHKRGRIGPTKTGRARRIAMSAQLRAALLPRALYGDPWLFPGRFAGPVGYTRVRATLTLIAQRVGLPDLNPHALRHFFCSYMCAEGADLLWVRDAAGHASVKQTEHYSGHFAARRPSILDRT
jgi:integrase